jgi:hypothetical protein
MFLARATVTGTLNWSGGNHSDAEADPDQNHCSFAKRMAKARKVGKIQSFIWPQARFGSSAFKASSVIHANSPAMLVLVYIRNLYLIV